MLPISIPMERMGIPPSSERTRAEEDKELNRQDENRRIPPKGTFVDHLKQSLPPGWAAPSEYMAPIAPELALVPVPGQPLQLFEAAAKPAWLDSLVDVKPEQGTTVVIPVAQMPMSQSGEVMVAHEAGAPLDVMQVPNLVVAQLHQMIKMGQPVTKLEVSLKPEHLGPVHLTVSMEQERVGVTLAASSTAAREELESTLKDIHALLVSSQLAPGELKVCLNSKSKQMSSGKDGDQSAASDGMLPVMRWAGRKRSRPDEELSVAV